MPHSFRPWVLARLEWIADPVVGTWYDFADATTQSYGQCRLSEPGLFEQEPRGYRPTVLALKGKP